MERTWWKEAVIYQVYVRSFMDSNGDGIGDIPGVISRLDYLKELGIDVIWLNPVYKSPNDDNGYDISDYRKIMDEFGTMADWEKLLEECHGRGIRLIMDLVVNHTSDEHPWFLESRKSKDNPYRDYYIWKPAGKGPKGEPNNWESIFSGSAWEWDEATGEYYLHLFSRKQPDLNWDNPKVHREIIDMMTWWLDKGIDGFRMDAVHLLKKPAGLPDSTNPPTHKEGYVGDEVLYAHNEGIHNIFREMNRSALSRYDVMTVAEMNRATPAMAGDYVSPRREELDMIFHFEICGLPRYCEEKKRISELNRIQQRWYDASWKSGWNSQYFNNHDQPRQVSAWGDDGKYRVQSAKLLATYLHTMPGSPYVYQGEEIGMTNFPFSSMKEINDVSLRNDWAKCSAAGESEEDFLSRQAKWTRENARTPMQWDDSPQAGFTTGTPWLKVNPNYREINVKSARSDPNSIFHYYRRLIALRKAHPVMIYGDYRLHSRKKGPVVVFTRTLEKEQLLVVLNFSSEKQVSLLPLGKGRGWKSILGNYADFSLRGRRLLRPWETYIMSRAVK
ncbi:MAG: alpha-glucosidase [Spirochaetales bacterium]|nr:alpha-glucosidase [Spirochaetales bacterium]